MARQIFTALLCRFFYAVPMKVTGLAENAGAGSTGRHTRSSDMDQLTFRNDCEMKHFDEDDWTLLGWQDRRGIDSPATRRTDSAKKGSSKSDTVIGVVYVGALVIFMLAYLT
jgi:hypothetical protein